MIRFLMAVCLSLLPNVAAAWDMSRCDDVYYDDNLPEGTQPTVIGPLFAEPGGFSGNFVCLINRRTDGEINVVLFEPTVETDLIHALYTEDRVRLEVHERAEVLPGEIFANCGRTEPGGIYCSTDLILGGGITWQRSFDETGAVSRLAFFVNLEQHLTAEGVADQWLSADPNDRIVRVRFEGVDDPIALSPNPQNVFEYGVADFQEMNAIEALLTEGTVRGIGFEARLRSLPEAEPLQVVQGAETTQFLVAQFRALQNAVFGVHFAAD